MIPSRRNAGTVRPRRTINRPPAVELLETRSLLSGIELTAVGTYETGVFDESAAEIVAHDPASQRAFFTNADSNEVGILDVSDPTNPIQVGAIDIAPFGGGVNSLDVHDGIVAVAVENDVVTQPGSVVFFDTDGLQLGQVTVGALPDSLTFTPDGSKVLVANEGEPDGSGNDPVGSVSIIDLSGGVSTATVGTASFESFDGQEDELRAQGVRIFSGKSVSQDVEPEYIAVSPDGLSARVTLQEANAFAVIDISTATVTDIQSLGVKDHSLPGNGLDASDRDGAINIANWPVFGMYMPDAVTSFEVGGQTFYATANEGDDRGEDERIKDLTLDPTAFPDAATLQLDENLGRLGVSTIDGDTDGDGDYDQLFSYGARSFTIWDADGNVVFDSGDQFEQITAAVYPDNFNANNDENDPEGRSDNKGPEPEAITTGVINGRTFAFVGLERTGGIMVYDVTNPASAEFVSYVNNRDFSEDPETGNPGDLGVEDLKFVSAEDSPNGAPLIVAANEVSGTITIFQISGSIYNDGVLELIGTSDNDVVRIKRKGFDRLQVKANFLDPQKEVYEASELDTIRVTTLEGNDRVIAQRFVNVDILAHLGSGNDIGIGGAGDDLFVGSGGNDLLKGGFGRNVLIGGAGRDRLHAGFFGNTMMIGGSTAFDDDSAALDLIMAEWTADRSFHRRVRNLSGGTGSVLGGTGVKLDTRGPDRTVFDDGDRDRMYGGILSRDWFFADVFGQDRDRLFGLTFFDRLDRI